MPDRLVAPELQSLTVPMVDLSLWPKNPRRGDVGAIAESLKRFGQLKPIVVQKSSMRVVAGNHVYRAAAALGWSEIAAVIVDVSDKQARAFVATDNRASELGSFDDADLLSLLAEIAKTDSLEGTGYDEDDLQDLLSKVGTGRGFGQGDPDGQKAIPELPWVEVGQVFQLGDHRLICGDGTSPDVASALLDGQQVDLLLVQPSADKGQFPTDLYDQWATHAHEQFWFEPQRYGLLGFDKELGGSFVVWDKRTENTQRDYAEAFELIWSKAKHPQAILRHTFVGAADGEQHGGPDFNERPSSMFMDLYERWSGFEAVIFDPIGLGNTPLLAAEKASRRYYGAKLDPGHVQATLEKWAEYANADIDDIRRSAETVTA